MRPWVAQHGSLSHEDLVAWPAGSPRAAPCRRRRCGGGLPIVDTDGVMIGAVGVSGSSLDDHHTVATAGAKALGALELSAHPWRA